MQWFKHIANMSFDPKVKRVIRRYGVEGYGLYCYILESIARGLSESSPYPELEEMSEDIAADLKMDSRRVEEIMLFMVAQGLFGWRQANDRIICMKMIDYLDEYHRKAGKASNIRKALEAIELRHTPDKLLTDSGDVAKNREEENREEENRKPARKRFKKPTIGELIEYGDSIGFAIDAQHFLDYHESAGWKLKSGNNMADWKATVRTWKRNNFNNSTQSTHSTGPTYAKLAVCRNKCTVCGKQRDLRYGKCEECTGEA